MARPEKTDRSVRIVREALAARGLLLEADARWSSVAALVAGEPIRGSWWGHPCGSLIYWVLEDLDAAHEVLRAKLIRGKVTLVHRRLWPSLVAVGAAGEAWQTRGLSPAARSLLARARRAGPLRLDHVSRWSFPRRIGDVARELERRLLVHAREVHTESGRHAKVLEDWAGLRERLGLESLPDVGAARESLEDAASEEGMRLPWQPAESLR